MTFRPQDLKYTYIEEAKRLFTIDSVNLLLSGGIDSEVMARSFQAVGVRFEVFIAGFEDNLNHKEVDAAVKLCNRIGIRPNFLNINARQYLNEILPMDAEKFGLSDIPTLFQYHLTNLVPADGIVVLGSSPYVRKHVPNGYVPGVYPYLFSHWEIVQRTNIWYDSKRVHHFASSDDCRLAFMMHPRTLELVSNRVEGKISTNTSRRIIYGQFEGIEERPRSYGFNKLQHDYKRVHDELTKLYPNSENVQDFFTELSYLMSIPRRGTYE